MMSYINMFVWTDKSCVWIKRYNPFLRAWRCFASFSSLMLHTLCQTNVFCNDSSRLMISHTNIFCLSKNIFCLNKNIMHLDQKIQRVSESLEMFCTIFEHNDMLFVFKEHILQRYEPFYNISFVCIKKNIFRSQKNHVLGSFWGTFIFCQYTNQERQGPQLVKLSNSVQPVWLDVSEMLPKHLIFILLCS